MKITFRLCPSVRDLGSKSNFEIEVEGINILYAFVHELQEKYPQYDLSLYRFKRGTKYIDLTTPLKEGEIIYIIPTL